MHFCTFIPFQYIAAVFHRGEVKLCCKRLQIDVTRVIEFHGEAGDFWIKSFDRFYPKTNILRRFLQSNKHPEKIFKYLARQVDAEPQKLGILSFQGAFSSPKTTKIFLTYYDIKSKNRISRTTFLILINFEKLYVEKIYPIFNGSFTNEVAMQDIKKTFQDVHLCVKTY